MKVRAVRRPEFKAVTNVHVNVHDIQIGYIRLNAQQSYY